MNCASCHLINGKPLVGPPLDKLFGKDRLLKDGTTVKADDEYLLKSIIDPGSQLVKFYMDGMMPYESILVQNEIESVIMYIKSLE